MPITRCVLSTSIALAAGSERATCRTCATALTASATNSMATARRPGLVPARAATFAAGDARCHMEGTRVCGRPRPHQHGHRRQRRLACPHWCRRAHQPRHRHACQRQCRHTSQRQCRLTCQRQCQHAYRRWRGHLRRHLHPRWRQRQCRHVRPRWRRRACPHRRQRRLRPRRPRPQRPPCPGTLPCPRLHRRPGAAALWLVLCRGSASMRSKPPRQRGQITGTTPTSFGLCRGRRRRRAAGMAPPRT